MNSTTKIPLPTETLQAIASEHFGTKRRLTRTQELKEGFFSTAARLEFDDGFGCVLKAAPPDHVRVLRYEKDLLRAEVEAMRMVRAQTSVPVAEIYAHDTSRRHLASDYFLMEVLPGVPFHLLRKEMPAEGQAEVERQMGDLAQQINTIRGERFGYFAQPEAAGGTWRECFGHMLEGVLLDGQDMKVSLPLEPAEMYQTLAAHFEVLDEVTSPCLVHWDLWDGNVFVDPKSGQVSGLIDFERVLWADPLMEAMFMDMNPDSHYVKGYGSNILSSSSGQRRRMLYNAYLLLIMVIECYYRLYENQDQENWARKQLESLLQKA